MVPPYGVLDASGAAKPALLSYQQSAPPWDAQCDGLN
jgi:hypothetical protein